MSGNLKPHFIEARDLPDLWFQAVHDVLDVGRKSKVDKGSYPGSVSNK
jgi:thymidylate synthase|tara:strand:- start:38114 stop:38257 length:144 start_codon:yes stop_codon:yes gene_type:complete